MENKVNDPVWEIRIIKYSNPNEYSYRDNGVLIKKHKIIGISQYKICVNTDWFETFYYKNKGERRSSCETYLNDVLVHIRTNNSILGDGVFATLYSTKKPTSRTLKKMMGKVSNDIDKNYGWLFSGVKDELWSMVETYDFKK